MKYKSDQYRLLEASTLRQALAAAQLIGWKFAEPSAQLLASSTYLYEPVAELVVAAVPSIASVSLPGLERAMRHSRSDGIVVRPTDHDAGISQLEWFVGRWRPNGISWLDRALAWRGEDGTIHFVEQPEFKHTIGVLAAGPHRLRTLPSVPWTTPLEEREGYLRFASAMADRATPH
jgi:hypothetical protein